MEQNQQRKDDFLTDTGGTFKLFGLLFELWILVQMGFDSLIDEFESILNI